MTRKRSFLFEAIEAEAVAGAQLHIRRLDQQLETRRVVVALEREYAPELRTGDFQDRLNAARTSAGMPTEKRGCNIHNETMDTVFRKAIKSGVKNLEKELAVHESNEQFSTEYRVLFGRAPAGLSRSDLAEAELVLTQTAAALEHVSNLLGD